MATVGTVAGAATLPSLFAGGGAAGAGGGGVLPSTSIAGSTAFSPFAAYPGMVASGATPASFAAAYPGTVASAQAARGIGSRIRGWFGRGDNATNLASLGAGLWTGNRAAGASERANTRAAEEQRRQWDENMAFLRQQEKDRLERDAANDAEKKRRWEAEEAEKRRQYDEKTTLRAPYRAAGRTALSQLMANDYSGRTRQTPYRPTISYRPR
ncbi:MAG: hypothetical protein O3C10_12680 [Chloroflexi bacterium]|nr:hypothetical protein [Chloroflexota bacterium]